MCIRDRLSEAIDMALEVLQPGDIVAAQVDGSGATNKFERLRDFGADVIEIPVYEWKVPEVAARRSGSPNP